MTLLKIRKCFDPVLRKKADKVKDITDEHRKLIEDMIETMYLSNGVGLAAPQVGESIQIIVCSPEFKRGGELVLINPVIVQTWDSCVFEEGCLSLPNISAKVKRAKKIKVKALNIKGENVEIEADDLMARVLLHEIDHLNGILFIDRVGFFKKQMLIRRLKQIDKEIVL